MRQRQRWWTKASLLSVRFCTRMKSDGRRPKRAAKAEGAFGVLRCTVPFWVRLRHCTMEQRCSRRRTRQPYFKGRVEQGKNGRLGRVKWIIIVDAFSPGLTNTFHFLIERMRSRSSSRKALSGRLRLFLKGKIESSGSSTPLARILQKNLAKCRKQRK